MKNLPWIIAAAAVGLAAYFIANTPGPQYATGSDTLEDAARDTSQWGSKQRVRGAGGRFVGKLKQGVATLTNDDQLSDQATTDEVNGSIKSAVGSIAQAAGQTLHDINR